MRSGMRVAAHQNPFTTNCMLLAATVRRNACGTGAQWVAKGKGQRTSSDAIFSSMSAKFCSARVHDPRKNRQGACELARHAGLGASGGASKRLGRPPRSPRAGAEGSERPCLPR